MLLAANMADKETPPEKSAAQEPAAAAETVAATPETTAAPAAAATEETTATTATGTTTTTAEEPGQEAGKDAVGVEGYEAEVQRALAESKAKLKKKAEPAEAAAPESTAAEVVEPDAPVVAEVQTATTEEAAAAAASAEEQRSDKRIRLKGLPDGHLVDAANEIARAESIPFAQAWERVAPKKAPEPSSAATTAPAISEAAPVLRTRDAIQADITAKKAEKRQAATDLDTGKMYDADEAIEALREEMGKVDAAERKAEQEHQTAQKTKFEKTVTESTAKAIEYWPEAEDEKSDLSKRTVELSKEYEKDPALAHLVSEANSPFYFTQLAAQEMGLLPKHLRRPVAAAPAAATTTTPKPATPTATKPAPKNQSAVVRPTQPAASPASGAARTTQGGKSKIEEAVDNIRNVSDYERVEQDLKAGRLALA
jgi:hypothetical protein